MEMVRAFIAIPLSPDVEARLQQVIDELQRQTPRAAVRWVPAKNIHVTLKFLGDVSAPNLSMVRQVLDREARRFVPFEFSVGELGAFPNLRRPRVVWVGVQAPEEMGTLQRSLENELAHLGYPPEDRPFSPHLTLGRVGRNATPQDVQHIGRLVAEMKIGSLGSLFATALYLIRSDLGPGGAVYSRIYLANLGGGAGKIGS